MLDALGKNPQRQRLDLLNGIFLRGTVAECTGYLTDLGNPASIRFTLSLNRKIHR